MKRKKEKQAAVGRISRICEGCGLVLGIDSGSVDRVEVVDRSMALIRL
ncbi:MAG: hypothetical protein GX130_09440 [Candidatus Hydrogenedens sp.]|nr:hypothetical protein [Candidatus Hydrogenedens sp.]